MMNRHTKFSLAIGAAALLGVSMLAVQAHADRSRGHHGWGGGSGALFERYDLNQDGEVTQEEVDRNRTEWHGQFDADNDGRLSLEEFQDLWLQARRQRMVREFQMFDRDGDAQVTMEEYQRPMSGIVERLDRTDSDSLTRDDFRRGSKKDRRARRTDEQRGDKSKQQ